MFKEMVEFVVRKIVEDQDAVVVSEVDNDQSVIIKLKVATNDLGKVIGKDGRTARSIRVLLQSISTQIGKKASLEIIE